MEVDPLCRWEDYRLPTDIQWEAAARGLNGWAYPWGDDWREDVCNSSEADLGATTPVGIFPPSAAHCGAHDMAGNVWEWCGDTFDPAKANEPDAGRKACALPLPFPFLARYETITPILPINAAATRGPAAEHAPPDGS